MNNKSIKTLIDCSGVVVHGNALGRTVGMPTANLEIDDNMFYIPGVYCGYATIDDNSKKYKTVVNIGNKPSVSSSKDEYIEAHLLDFDDDIYGHILHLSIYKKIRKIRKLKNLKEVKKQVDKDINTAKKLLNDMENKKGV